MCTIWAEMLISRRSRSLILALAILFLEWYDLDRGVAHLGQGVAQLSQVLSFLAEVIVTLVAEVLLLADVVTCRCVLPSLLHTLCQRLVLSINHLFELNQPGIATCPS